jgi:hypothetical protein
MLTKNEQILALIIFITIVYFTWKINNLEKKSIENFALTDADTIEAINTAVKKIYLTDVEAIRLLSNFAIQLSQGGTTVPGNVNFTGQVAVNGQNLLLGTTNKWNIHTPANGSTSMFIAPVKTDGTSDWTKQLQFDGANRMLTLGGVTANGNVSVTGDVSSTGNVTATGNITTTNGTISGATISAKNLIGTENLNIKSVANASIDAISMTNNGNINATGIVTCKEISCPVIGGGGAIGAWLVNGGSGCLPIFSSIDNYDWYYDFSGKDDQYIIMPGYKLIVWLGAYYDSKYYLTMNNTNGTKPLRFAPKKNWNNEGRACKLYFKDVEIGMNNAPEAQYIYS